MLTVRSVPELRAELAARGGWRPDPARPRVRVGLVPTMGALHEGHLSLMRRARAECDLVVVSVFVNPRQFDDAGDLAVYPRDEARDAELVAAQGAELLFAPAVDEVYPPGSATTVSVGGPSEPLEGAHRGAAHFQGVTTVVCKLLNMADPDVAYFGQKDAQQAMVIRRMVRDLDLDVRIVVCPIVRDADGLALSSRNALLSAVHRDRAPVLHRALESVVAAVADGERDPRPATAPGRAMIAAAGAELEYLELVDLETMQPLERVTGDTLAVIAARLGDVRLIDNERLTIPSHPPTGPVTARAPEGAVTADRT